MILTRQTRLLRRAFLVMLFVMVGGWLSAQEKMPEDAADQQIDLSQVNWDEEVEGEEETDLSQVNWDEEVEGEEETDLSQVNWDESSEGEEQTEEAVGEGDDFVAPEPPSAWSGVFIFFAYIAGMFTTVLLSSKSRLYKKIPRELLIPLHMLWPVELLAIAFLRMRGHISFRHP